MLQFTTVPSYKAQDNESPSSHVTAGPIPNIYFFEPLHEVGFWCFDFPLASILRSPPWHGPGTQHQGLQAQLSSEGTLKGTLAGPYP